MGCGERAGKKTAAGSRELKGLAHVGERQGDSVGPPERQGRSAPPPWPRKLSKERR